MTRRVTHTGVGAEATPVAPVALHDIVDGKYRVEAVIGCGGMGCVVRATHVDLESTVALKFLLPEFVENEDARRRMLREARAAARLRSKHVARVLDVGTLPSGVPFIVMEYLEGWDLAALLHERGLEIREVVGCVLQVCDALAEAHAVGIVHRDLKPENVFLTTDADGEPCIKVLDFGISKHLLPGSFRATSDTVTMIGSPLYMSPEQMTSPANVDARADIWGLGVLMYEMLAGRPAFEGATLPQICANVLNREPTPVRALRADVPRELEAVVARCLVKAADGRFASVAELVQAIREAVAPTRVGAPHPASDDGVDEDVVWWEHKLRRSRGRFARGLIAFVAVLALGSGVALALLDPARRVEVLTWRPGKPVPLLHGRAPMAARPAEPGLGPLNAQLPPPASAAPSASASAPPPASGPAPAPTVEPAPAQRPAPPKAVPPRAPPRRSPPKPRPRTQPPPHVDAPPPSPSSPAPSTSPPDPRPPAELPSDLPNPEEPLTLPRGNEMPNTDDLPKREPPSPEPDEPRD